MINLQAHLLIASSYLLVACQGTMPQVSIPFTLDAGVFGAHDLSRTSERGAYGKTEVLYGEGDKGEFSVAYVSTNSMGVIAETGDAPKLVLKGWNALRGKSRSYGSTGKVEAPSGSINYQHFSFEGKNCVHFHMVKQRATADNLARYRQLLSGYACMRNGEKIENKTISSFLNSIKIPHFSVSIYEKNALPVTLFDPVRPVRAKLFFPIDFE